MLYALIAQNNLLLNFVCCIEYKCGCRKWSVNCRRDQVLLTRASTYTHINIWYNDVLTCLLDGIRLYLAGTLRQILLHINDELVIRLDAF